MTIETINAVFQNLTLTPRGDQQSSGNFATPAELK